MVTHIATWFEHLNLRKSDIRHFVRRTSTAYFLIVLAVFDYGGWDYQTVKIDFYCLFDGFV